MPLAATSRSIFENQISTLDDGGFRVERLETRYLPGWRPAGDDDRGAAVPR